MHAYLCVWLLLVQVETWKFGSRCELRDFGIGADFTPVVALDSGDDCEYRWDGHGGGKDTKKIQIGSRCMIHGNW